VHFFFFYIVYLVFLRKRKIYDTFFHNFSLIFLPVFYLTRWFLNKVYSIGYYLIFRKKSGGTYPFPYEMFGIEVAPYRRTPKEYYKIAVNRNRPGGLRPDYYKIVRKRDPRLPDSHRKIKHKYPKGKKYI
jgi:hypothetical protein